MGMFDDSMFSGLKRQVTKVFKRQVVVSDQEIEALKRENREAGRAAPGDLSSTSGGNNEAKLIFKPITYGGDLDD
jgi:hypothetical protein